MNAWYAWPAYQAFTQTNHIRWCVNTIRSPDDEHCDARNMYRDIINKDIKSTSKRSLEKNHKSIFWWVLPATDLQKYALITQDGQKCYMNYFVSVLQVTYRCLKVNMYIEILFSVDVYHFKFHTTIFIIIIFLLLVFSPWAGLGRDQSSVRRLVWLWYAVSWANS